MASTPLKLQTMSEDDIVQAIRQTKNGPTTIHPVKKGRVIMVDGFDGCGKTTLCRILYERLQGLYGDNQVISTALFGGSSLSAYLRAQLFKDRNTPPGVREEVMTLALGILSTADMIDHAINKGQWVVVDRSILSFYAYQCIGRDSELANLIYEDLLMFDDRLNPDLLIYLDIDLETALSRKRNANEEQYFERESEEYHRRVIRGFMEAYDAVNDWEQPYRIHRLRIDGQDPIADHLPEIFSRIDRLVAS